MREVYLIHGWGGSSKGGWFDWLEDKLKGRVIAKAFDMPNTDFPRIGSWVGFLQKNVKVEDINEQTYFVGHSIGCQTILRV